MRTPQRNDRILVDRPVTLVHGGEHTDLDLRPNRPSYVTTDGVEVWLERKTQRTRFLDADGAQVGPWHANLVPAIIWAANEGWRDPSLPASFTDAVIAEVRAGGAPGDRHQPKDAPNNTGEWVAS